MHTKYMLLTEYTTLNQYTKLKVDETSNQSN